MAITEDITAARRTQLVARDKDDEYLEIAATSKIDRLLDRLLREREGK